MIDIAQIRADLEATLPAVVARSQISHYLGGCYTPATMAVYDSKGIGVKDPVRLSGQKIGYSKQNLIDWFIARLEAANAQKEDNRHEVEN